MKLTSTSCLGFGYRPTAASTFDHVGNCSVRCSLADDGRHRELFPHVLDILVGIESGGESRRMPADDRAGRVVEVPPVPAVAVLSDLVPEGLEMRLAAQRRYRVQRWERHRALTTRAIAST
jgi:hypothetical protein